jgi:uncharacterized membrane protein YoaK (UPF0700 family)
VTPAAAPAPRAVVGTLLALTVTTGLIDAVSYLGLGHVFTANMTGNVVLLGFGLAGSDGLPILAPLVSLAAFVGGAALGGVAIRRAGGASRELLGGALLVEGILAAVATLLAVSTTIHAGTVVAGIVIAILAAAMGLRNAVVRKLAVPELTTTVLTMTVTGLASDGLRHAAQPRRIGAVVAMLVGALVGALLLKADLWVPLAAIAAVATALGWVARGVTRPAPVPSAPAP